MPDIAKLQKIFGSPIRNASSGLRTSTPWCKSVVKRDKEEALRKIQKCIIPRKRTKLKRDKRTTGLQRVSGEGLKQLDKLIENLNKLDTRWPRSKHQRIFHRAFTAAALLQILTEEELFTNLPSLRARLDLPSELRAELLVQTPRRFGKTMGTALWTAAYLCSVSSVNGKRVCVYSTGKRASTAFQVLVYEMCVHLVGKDAVPKKTEEEIHVRTPEGTINRANFYPASTNISIYFLKVFFTTQ
jgi:hypothetical protein